MLARAHNPCLGSQQFDLSDGGGAVVEPELAALYLLLALAVRRCIADRVFEAPHSDLAVAAPGYDAATERVRGEERVIRTYMGERDLS